MSPISLLTVLRYVERNPVRAGLVERAEAWQWSRAWGGRPKHPAELFRRPPLELPRNWVQRLNRPETDAELAALHRSTPFGSPEWAVRAAAQMGLEASLRPRGRPRLDPKEQQATK